MEILKFILSVLRAMNLDIVVALLLLLAFLYAVRWLVVNTGVFQYLALKNKDKGGDYKPGNPGKNHLDNNHHR